MAAMYWLRNNNINYREISITQDGVTEELFSLGYRSTPVIVIGDRTIVGFNPQKLAEAIS